MAKQGDGDRQHLPIGEILISMGLLKEPQLRESLALQKEKGGALGHILSEVMGVVQREDVMRALGIQAGMEVVDLEGMQIPPEVLDKVSFSIANMYRVVPFRFENGMLTIAMADPRNVAALDDLKFMTNCEVQGAVSSEAAVAKAIRRSEVGIRKSEGRFGLPRVPPR